MVDNSKLGNSKSPPNGAIWGLTIKDCPKWLADEFTEEAYYRTNDCYWALLLDWYNKARSFDLLMNQGLIEEQNKEPIKQDTKKEQDEIKTMGD